MDLIQEELEKEFPRRRLIFVPLYRTITLNL